MTNIFVTGTPATGKTRLCQILKTRLNQEYVNLSEVIKLEKLYDCYDEEYCSYVMNERKVFRYLREKIKTQPIILDYHGCSFVKPDWFSHIFVLRTNIEKLADRYARRNYSDFKTSENIDSEIFQVILDEAVRHFGPEKVVELNSDMETDIEKNVSIILSYVNKLV